ncbi:MAG: hypothetical protein WC876_07580 [Candidatus Thermoplasmatota archaeon]
MPNKNDLQDPIVKDTITAATCEADNPHRVYLINRISKIRAAALRNLVAAYAVMLITIEKLAVATAYLRVHGLVRFVNSTGITDIDQATKAVFNSHFRALINEVGSQTWYEHQRHVLDFMTFALKDEEEARRRVPAAKPKKDWYPNTVPWYEWSYLRCIWMRLNLQERVQFCILASTCVRASVLLRLRVTAAYFERDGLCMLTLPSLPRTGERYAALHFGEKSVAALIRLSKDATRTIQWFFPDPKDPTKHMSYEQLGYLLNTWAHRAGLDELSPRKLQDTMACYLLGRDVSPQLIAYLMGTTTTKRLNRMHGRVKLAQENGHLAAQPSFTTESRIAGLVVCEACGRNDNGADAAFCAGCGSDLKEDASDEESQIRAEMIRRFQKLLDLAGETAVERVTAAINSTGTSAAAAAEVGA